MDLQKALQRLAIRNKLLKRKFLKEKEKNNYYMHVNKPFNFSYNSDKECSCSEDDCSCSEYDSCSDMDPIKVSVLFHNMETICDSADSVGKYIITWLIMSDDESLSYIKGSNFSLSSESEIMISAKSIIRNELGIKNFDISLCRETFGRTTTINNEHPFDGARCPCIHHSETIDIDAIDISKKGDFLSTGLEYKGLGVTLSRGSIVGIDSIKKLTCTTYNIDNIELNTILVLYTDVSEFNKSSLYRDKFAITWILVKMKSNSPTRGLHHCGYDKIAFHSTSSIVKFIEKLNKTTIKIKDSNIVLHKEMRNTVTYVNGYHPFKRFTSWRS